MLQNALMGRTAFSLSRIVAAALLTLALVAGYITPTLAVGGQTGNLSGTIVDTVTKAPIVNATVTAASTSTRSSTRTDKSGSFQFLGLPSDTYVVSIAAPGYESFNLTGITVQGDQNVNLGSQPISKSLQTIGRTSARSRTSVYQPSATQDQVTVSGTRAVEAAGKVNNTSENALALSVPGVQLTANGRLTIRGGQANEVGYQLDGVNFTEPFLSTNQSNGRLNGLGSLQVVEGAGDASQGNVGAGVINVTVKRGARPAFGLLDLEATGPNFDHQLGLDYGFATPDGRLSNYISFIGQRQVPYYGRYQSDPATVGQFFGIGQRKNNDLINNFVYKFGKDNNQSLQVLYENRDLQQNYGAAGRLSNGQYYTSDPYSYTRNAIYVCGSPSNPGCSDGSYGGLAANPNIPGTYGFFYNKVALTPNVNPNVFGTLPTPFESSSFPGRYIKFEYQNNLNNSTLLQLRSYNTEYFTHNQGSVVNGSSNPRDAYNGGQRAGLGLDVTKTLGDKNTLTIGGLLENAHPIWQESDPYAIFRDLPYAGLSINDFVDPANPNAPISAANPCLTGATNAAGTAFINDPSGCYLYSTGQFPGGTGRIPSFGINYFQADFQTISGYIRDQFQVGKKLKFDVGFRYDIDNYKQGRNPYNADLVDPQDVGAAFIRDNVIHPKIPQPRFAVSYQFGANDAARFSYGRSAEFLGGQTFGTPGGLVSVDPRLFNVAPAPGSNVAGDPTTWTCGSGYNPKYLIPVPAGGTSPNDSGNGGGYFQCKNYAQQIYWAEDQNNDAPDLGNIQPPTATNIDLALQHQFKNGMAMRLTGYFKRQFNVPAFALVKQVLDSNGVQTSAVFAGNNVGINKTSGAEFGFSLPDRPIGWSGYLSATYTNVIQSVPPLISNEDQVPLVTNASLALQKTYRAGFLSPFVINAGAQYKTKSGWRFNPIVNYDRGFPIGVGTTTPSGATSAAGGQINGAYYTIPQTNLGFGQPGALSYLGTTGAIMSTQYVDPVNPGNYFRPNIAATRGTAETSAPGGVLSRPRAYANMSIEYAVKKNTFGLFVSNLFNNVYSEPVLNPQYQPVATGISGPSSGTQSAAFNPASNTYIHGSRNVPIDANPKGAYLELPNQAPRTFNFYYQLGL